MDGYQELSLFINRIASDTRLKPIHLALSTALCQAWIVNQFQNSYHVSRRKLMRASRIHSKATYHKTLHELMSFGYLEYYPSYHPIHGSLVRLMTPVAGAENSITH